MKIAKKVLSVVLALVMVVGLLPSAFAALNSTVDQQGTADVGTVNIDLDIMLYDEANDTWSAVADDA